MFGAAVCVVVDAVAVVVGDDVSAETVEERGCFCIDMGVGIGGFFWDRELKMGDKIAPWGIKGFLATKGRL